ncbi:hypothetical protein G4228_017673, partial [Cervus hanglu yarkandensis]
RSGPGAAACRLSRAESERRCRAPGQPPGGALCHGRGRCDCGVCICHVSEPGVYFGPLCECHEWVCETYDGSTCAGHGKCDCGRCKCDEGWFGDACQYPTNCDLTKKKSNQMCKNSQDIICSNAGTCHCGRCKCDNSDGNGLVYGKFCECDDRECIDDETEEICGGICVCGECSCHDVDPTGDWGDIHGDTCECDERDCRAVYDRYSDDFCSGHGQCNCGRCDCKVGWFGKKCEHPRSCPLSAEESIRKCQGSATLPCSGRGKCECGKCTCYPPGDSRVYGKACECDDRRCEDLDGVVCGGNGICSCGNCECWDGWNGNACEIWLGTEYP